MKNQNITVSTTGETVTAFLFFTTEMPYARPGHGPEYFVDEDGQLYCRSWSEAKGFWTNRIHPSLLDEPKRMALKHTLRHLVDEAIKNVPIPEKLTCLMDRCADTAHRCKSAFEDALSQEDLQRAAANAGEVMHECKQYHREVEFDKERIARYYPTSTYYNS